MDDLESKDLDDAIEELFEKAKYDEKAQNQKKYLKAAKYGLTLDGAYNWSRNKMNKKAKKITKIK